MDLLTTLDSTNDIIRRLLPVQFQGDSVNGDNGMGYLHYTKINDTYIVCYAVASDDYAQPLTLAQKNNMVLQATAASFEEAEDLLKAILDTFEVTE